MNENIHAGMLHYEDFGTGPTVVILHDYPSNRELREGPCEALVEAGCRVVVTNPAGLGGSRWEGVDPGACSDRVAALLNCLGIGRAVFIGISLGGYVLLDLLERFPARVAEASFVLSPDLAADLRRRAGRPEVLAAVREGRFDDLGKVFPATLPEPPASRLAPAQLHRLRAWAGNVRQRSLGLARRGRKDCAALLGRLELPPLFVEGEEGGSRTPGRDEARSRGLGRLPHRLLRLIQSLLPPEECFAEEDDGERRTV